MRAYGDKILEICGCRRVKHAHEHPGRRPRSAGSRAPGPPRSQARQARAPLTTLLARTRSQSRPAATPPTHDQARASSGPGRPRYSGRRGAACDARTTRRVSSPNHTLALATTASRVSFDLTEHSSRVRLLGVHAWRGLPRASVAPCEGVRGPVAGAEMTTQARASAGPCDRAVRLAGHEGWQVLVYRRQAPHFSGQRRSLWPRVSSKKSHTPAAERRRVIWR